MIKYIKENYRKVIIYGIIYISLMLFFTYPLPYELLMPGGVESVDHILEYETPYEPKGSFNSSYVSVVTKPSPFQYLMALTNDKTDIVKMTKTQSQLSVKEINESDRIEKIQSIYTSIILAYQYSGNNLQYDKEGVIVSYRFPGYESFDKFQVGDIILEMNGDDIENAKEFKNHLRNMGCEKTFELTIKRNDLIKDIVVKQPKVEDKCMYLPIIYYNNYTDLQGIPTFEIVDKSGYGSSAGLIQTLSIYNAITPVDITYNLKIAGTGVIAEDGVILPIAGVKQKVFGACKADVDIFFVPDIEVDGKSLYMEALKAKAIMKSDIKIVPVKTFDEALSYLITNYGQNND